MQTRWPQLAQQHGSVRGASPSPHLSRGSRVQLCHAVPPPQRDAQGASEAVPDLSKLADPEQPYRRIGNQQYANGFRIEQWMDQWINRAPRVRVRTEESRKVRYYGV